MKRIVKITSLTFAMVLNLSIVITSVAVFSKAQASEREKVIANEIECLALNIYFETSAISLAASMSVSDVVLNRVNHRSYPNTVCEVVKDGYREGRKDCQFSWYCDGKSDVPKNSAAWEKARKFARDFYVYKKYVGITEGATHYHASYVRPFWAPSLDRVGRIGPHIFYRIKGK